MGTSMPIRRSWPSLSSNRHASRFIVVSVVAHMPCHMTNKCHLVFKRGYFETHHVGGSQKVYHTACKWYVACQPMKCHSLKCTQHKQPMPSVYIEACLTCLASKSHNALRWHIAYEKKLMHLKRTKQNQKHNNDQVHHATQRNHLAHYISRYRQETWNRNTRRCSRRIGAQVTSIANHKFHRLPARVYHVMGFCIEYILLTFVSTFSCVATDCCELHRLNLGTRDLVWIANKVS